MLISLIRQDKARSKFTKGQIGEDDEDEDENEDEVKEEESLMGTSNE